ncbi:MAG: guanylate kinase, partial [Desulfonatronovibrionaceae bacterium]
MNKGTLLIISAPSGTGKSTLIRKLLHEHPEFSFSISYTTRAPRTGEIHGRDYYFTDNETFKELRERDFFAEWAEVHGNFYGTPREEVLKSINSGQSLIFDIDVQGALQLKKNIRTGIYVFIFPPTLNTLKERLLKRRSETGSTLTRRLKNAQEEIAQSRKFDFWIINENLDQACSQLKALIQA